MGETHNTTWVLKICVDAHKYYSFDDIP